MTDLHECETSDLVSLDYISICCGAERHEYSSERCGQCHENTTFECTDCGKHEGITNITLLESGEWRKFNPAQGGG